MADIKQKRILIPIFNRAHYGRLRSVLSAVDQHPSLELKIIISSPVAYKSFFSNLRHSRPNSLKEALPWYIKARLFSILPKFGKEEILKRDFLMRNLKEDGYSIEAKVPMFFDGCSGSSMAKAAGFGILKIADVLEKINPDIVFVNADRFEMMSIALAAAYMNIPIAHNEGGDISGTIDESIRHAITKLAHIHFVSTEASRKRVIQMGENPKNVFVVGSPAVDVVKNIDLDYPQDNFLEFDWGQPFLLVLFHPVATESAQSNLLMAENILNVIEELKMPTLFLGSNLDAYSKEIGLATKRFIAKKLPFVFFTKHLPPDIFYRALAKTVCAVGNSSSFIREGAYFGTSAVIVGSRQQNRERGENVLEVGVAADEIKEAIARQIQHGKYQPNLMFGDGRAGERIAEILKVCDVSIQKKFNDLGS